MLRRRCSAIRNDAPRSGDNGSDRGRRNARFDGFSPGPRRLAGPRISAGPRSPDRHDEIATMRRIIGPGRRCSEVRAAFTEQRVDASEPAFGRAELVERGAGRRGMEKTRGSRRGTGALPIGRAASEPETAEHAHDEILPWDCGDASTIATDSLQGYDRGPDLTRSGKESRQPGAASRRCATRAVTLRGGEAK